MADKWPTMALSKTDGCCAYCGKQLERRSDWHMEHVVPRVAGGRKGIENIIPACVRCNTAKGYRDPEQFRQHIVQELIDSLKPFSETTQWFDGLLSESIKDALGECNAQILELLNGAKIQFYAEHLLREIANGQ